MIALRTLCITVFLLGMLSPIHAAELYTPLIPNLGHFECTVVNTSSVARAVEIQIIFEFDSLVVDPIEGMLNPGGFLIATQIQGSSVRRFARGVARVRGRPADVRAICVSRESEDSPTGLTAVAEPFTVTSNPRGANP